MTNCPNCGSSSFPDNKYHDAGRDGIFYECQECWNDFPADEINEQEYIELKLRFKKNEYGGLDMKKQIADSSDTVTRELLRRIESDYKITIYPDQLGAEVDQ